METHCWTHMHSQTHARTHNLHNHKHTQICGLFAFSTACMHVVIYTLFTPNKSIQMQQTAVFSFSILSLITSCPHSGVLNRCSNTYSGHHLDSVFTVLLAAAGAGSSYVCRAALAPSVGSSSKDAEDRWQWRAICAGFRTHGQPMGSMVFCFGRRRHQTQPKVLFNGQLCLLSRLLVRLSLGALYLSTCVLAIALAHIAVV